MIRCHPFIMEVAAGVHGGFLSTWVVNMGGFEILLNGHIFITTFLVGSFFLSYRRIDLQFMQLTVSASDHLLESHPVFLKRIF